jgi:ribosomal protein S18 acetylase RimI-like enzyme
MHAKAIDQGFLPTLGEPFLALLYQAIDESHGASIFVEERNGNIVGFVAGGVGMKPIYKRLLLHPFRLSLALIPSLFRPGRWRRIAEIVRHTSKSPGEARFPSAELMSLAVAEGWRGKGIAEVLYQRLRQSFAERGISEFKIIVGGQLDVAQRFYRRMGAEAVSQTEIHGGESSVIFTHRI